jgi:ABC-type sugar transport system ATPase subunit
MAEVILEKVGKTYPGGVEALRDLSLCAAGGALLVLMGPSGCGKTTTLRLIAGLETPTAGNIHIGGRPVVREPPNRRDVAMVFQRSALYPHLNVRDNLLFGLAMRRWGRHSCLPFRRGRQECLPHVERVARLMGLTEVLERRPAELSGDSSSGWRWGGRCCDSPLSFCSTSPSATWIRSSVRKCAASCTCSRDDFGRQ